MADLVELSPYAARAWSPGGFWRSVRAAVACIDRFRPDLIHANNVWPTQVGVAAAALRHVPVVGYVRATTFRSGRELSLMRLADHVVAVSERVARPFRAMRLRRGPVTVVYNPVCVDAPTGPPRPRDEAPLRLAVAGRLSSEKADNRTIDLLAWLRAQGLDAALTIYGDGPERPALARRVAERRLGQWVSFAGFCPDLPHRLAQADALLLSSLREAMPRVLAEAGLVGVPTVTVPVGGVAEVIDSGHNGLLVEDFESSASRQAILAVLRSRDRLREMGRRMRELCLRYFAPARAFEATWEVYRQVLSAGGWARARRPQP